MDNETVYILTKSVSKCITKYREGEGGGVAYGLLYILVTIERGGECSAPSPPLTRALVKDSFGKLSKNEGGYLNNLKPRKCRLPW